MFGISFIRVLRNALRNFRRNVWLSVATIIIMTLTLLMMSFLYFINVLGAQILNNIESKVDLSATFNRDVSQDQINIIAEDIRARQDVQDVRIVSSEEALEIFRKRHADEPLFEDSLRELEENPLSANMYIVATDPRFYGNITQQLQTEKYAPYLESVNYDSNQQLIIERLIRVMSGVRNIGMFATILLATVVILIMFNTIRLAIYSFREEIDIMKLVGASNWFIRGPFVIEAVIVALISIIVSIAILYPILNATSPQIVRFFFDGQGEVINLYEYAINNWPTVVGLQFALSVGLAVFSSMIAIRRYLR